MDFVIYALSLFMLFIGWLFAYVAYRRKIVRINEIHADKLDTVERLKYNHGYDAGWTAAINDAELVRKQCNKFYHTHFV